MTELNDVRATVLEEEMVEQRFSVPAAPTKTAATRRTSQRAKRAIEPSSLRSLQIALEIRWCRRRSQTKSVSARTSSNHRRVIWVHDGCDREQKDQ